MALHQIDVGYLFGYGVLDLNAGIHFDEYVLTGVVADRVNQEFDGASVLVANCCGEGYGVAIESLPQLLVNQGRWCNLNNLLVSSLNRAVALEKVNHVSECVCQNLHFDVPWSNYCLLQEHPCITESAFCFARCFDQSSSQILLGCHSTHAATAAACDSLNENRKSDFVGLIY